MAILSVLYPKSDSSHFNHEYYTKTHLPLLQERWTGMGLEHVQLTRGTASVEGGAPAFEVILLVTFSSLNALQAALGAHGAELMEDVPRFTNIQALLHACSRDADHNYPDIRALHLPAAHALLSEQPVGLFERPLRRLWAAALPAAHDAAVAFQPAAHAAAALRTRPALRQVR